jgi:predicted DNA-binding ribbon-helix-helix protein
MNFVEIMLGEKLKDADPALDVMGSDRKVLQVACQDFTNYLKFHWNLIGKEASQCELVEKLEKEFHENPAELEAFLTVYTGMWLKKWKERFNLLIGPASIKPAQSIKNEETLAKGDSMWVKLACRDELTNIVVNALIRNSEICGTTIIAENLIKTVLAKQNDHDINSKEQTLSILSELLRKVQEVAHRRGPLVSIRVEKSYYCQMTN